MKKLFLSILGFIFFVSKVLANGNDSSKFFYLEAKTQLENLIQSTESNKYEKAIFLIENAWYENDVKYESYTKVLDKHIENIKKIIKSQYDYTNYEKKALAQSQHKTPSTSFLNKLTINEPNYKRAISNYAIYNYIKKPFIVADTEKALVQYPYQYSHEDPKATANWENSQVIHLNNTHKGNCFALASFFKILSDRFESDAKLCTAPNHIYIKHADPTGRDYNVELGTTSFPSAGHISTVTYTTEQAIKNSISQQSLSETQTIALCFVYLAKGYEFKYGNKTDKFILECAETALKYDEKCLNAMLLKAEYLENQITANNNQEQKKELERVLTKLYDLGYREMPLDMKNILVKMYLHDTITKLQKATYNKPETNQTRYASLSWGLFDERHEAKALERYGNALFDIKTKKIVKFEPAQTTYNGYNFDPVVFALQVDPLAAKYPSMSPYLAFAGNPILYIDKDGREFDFSQISKTEKQSYDAMISKLNKSELFQNYYKALETSTTCFVVKFDEKFKKQGEFQPIDNTLTIKNANTYVLGQELFHAYQVDQKLYDIERDRSTIETEGDIMSNYVVNQAIANGAFILKPSQVEQTWGKNIAAEEPTNQEVQSEEYNNKFQNAVNMRIEFYKEKKKTMQTEDFNGYIKENSGSEPKAMKKVFEEVNNSK
jgi:hypothetical protein